MALIYLVTLENT